MTSSHRLNYQTHSYELSSRQITKLTYCFQKLALSDKFYFDECIFEELFLEMALYDKYHALSDRFDRILQQLA
jgi:hypothetical protein